MKIDAAGSKFDLPASWGRFWTGPGKRRGNSLHRHSGPAAGSSTSVEAKGGQAPRPAKAEGKECEGKRDKGMEKDRRKKE